MTFQPEHLLALERCRGSAPARTWSGRIPTDWCDSVLNAGSRPSKDILSRLQQVGSSHLTRDELRTICRDRNENVLVGYICTMAWGAQHARNARTAWARREELNPRLNRLRNESLARAAAYDLFTGVDIPGLGPAYFTKLLYFFSPSSANYIMDQWTAKSMILLTGDRLVEMSMVPPGGPTRLNSGRNYQRFCEAIDCLARKLHLSGEKTEELIFSAGGRNAGCWRRHVREHWPVQ
jgi:hypothetical protein